MGFGNRLTGAAGAIALSELGAAGWMCPLWHHPPLHPMTFVRVFGEAGQAQGSPYGDGGHPLSHASLSILPLHRYLFFQSLKKNTSASD